MHPFSKNLRGWPRRVSRARVIACQEGSIRCVPCRSLVTYISSSKLGVAFWEAVHRSINELLVLYILLYFLSTGWGLYSIFGLVPSIPPSNTYPMNTPSSQTHLIYIASPKLMRASDTLPYDMIKVWNSSLHGFGVELCSSITPSE